MGRTVTFFSEFIFEVIFFFFFFRQCSASLSPHQGQRRLSSEELSRRLQPRLRSMASESSTRSPLACRRRFHRRLVKKMVVMMSKREARNEFKSSEFRRMKKQVARILTVRREREIEEGIGKRLSRKLDRQWKKSIVVRPPPSLKKLQEEEAAEEAAEAAKSA
ncbi:hypothetical protein HID58_049872 [Brassica napus]|uniref:Uncharacterized protein n=2 Tax=Brassica napus TaxID=3708 RepID=A0ABQ8B692_BRANA|nr:hypothetical protein HID58_049872 [Brassica napus]CDY33973.1 BnaC02g43640D [Brassica napus]